MDGERGDEAGAQQLGSRQRKSFSHSSTQTMMPEFPSKFEGERERTSAALRTPPLRRYRPSFLPTSVHHRHCLIRLLVQLLPGASLGSVSDAVWRSWDYRREVSDLRRGNLRIRHPPPAPGASAGASRRTRAGSGIGNWTLWSGWRMEVEMVQRGRK